MDLWKSKCFEYSKKLFGKSIVSEVFRCLYSLVYLRPLFKTKAT